MEEIFQRVNNQTMFCPKWNKEELSEFIEIEPLFTEIVKSYVNQGIDKTMNKFNC